MTSKQDIESDISNAIVAGDANTLRTTIASHSLVESKMLDGWLSLAAQLGQLETLRVLLDAGAPVDWANEDGETAFSYACSQNQLDAAKMLFQHGANVNSELSSGLTPLDCAVCHAHPDFREWLRGVGGFRNSNYDEWPWPTPENA